MNQKSDAKIRGIGDYSKKTFISCSTCCDKAITMRQNKLSRLFCVAFLESISNAAYQPSCCAKAELTILLRFRNFLNLLPHTV